MYHGHSIHKHTHIHTRIYIHIYMRVIIFYEKSKSLIVYSKTTEIGRLNGGRLMANLKSLHFPASLGTQRPASPSPRYLLKGSNSYCAHMQALSLAHSANLCLDRLP